MTTEIIIINRQGIALAADSAVTVNRSRVWKNANKIISLSPRNDIAIMIHNAADFIGIPWEVVIKNFRDDFCERQFETVDECADSFFVYLQSYLITKLHNVDAMEYLGFLSIIEDIKKYCDKNEGTVHKRISAYREILRKDISDSEISFFDEPFDAFKYKNEKIIRDLLKTVFPTMPQRKTSDLVIDICFDVLRRKYPGPYDSGVVFAGFGADEFLPSVIHFCVDGTINGKIRYWKVNERNLNKMKVPSAAVMPFAQDDMIFLFMEGIFEKYLIYLNSAVQEILNMRSKEIIEAYVKDDSEKIVEKRLQETENSTIVNKLRNQFSEYRKKIFTKPILDVLQSLPKEEMADMAEALVEITSLRRKVSNKIESVGGPTDVAIISKGDGVVWIRRKHYFDLDMNGDFSYRKSLKLKGG